ncbi:hypothetical protein RQCS_58230 (plasmid) [Rhodococcus qingshengii]|nr:hypothetical protein RQCS_58230 [Rhodococcus qingshengii]
MALRDDLYRSVRLPGRDMPGATKSGVSTEVSLQYRADTNYTRIERAQRTLSEIDRAGSAELDALTVAGRQIRLMTGPF